MPAIRVATVRERSASGSSRSLTVPAPNAVWYNEGAVGIRLIPPNAVWYNEGMTERAQVTVEFFSVPRERAGRTEIAVPAGTVGHVLAAVQRACPGLSGLVQPDGTVSRHYLLSLDGQRFVTDLTLPIEPGGRLWLLFADAGG